jgi:hypothetical protein
MGDTDGRLEHIACTARVLLAVLQMLRHTALNILLLYLLVNLSPLSLRVIQYSNRLSPPSPVEMECALNVVSSSRDTIKHL